MIRLKKILNGWNALSNGSLGQKLPIRAFYISLISGLILACVIPPFQAPDEVNHFYKAWQISEGQFLTLKENQRVGGYIPHSVDSLAHYFSQYRFAPQPDISAQEILSALQLPLKPEVRSFRDYPNTGMYNPVGYLPQLLFMPVMIQLECPPLWILYAGRIGSVIVWSLSVWICLGWLPAYRVLFALLAFLPMSLFVHASVSADVVLNASAFILLALFLRKKQNPQIVTKPEAWALGGVGMVLASVKLVYAPLLLLLALLPVSVWGGSSRRWVVGSLILLMTLSLMLFWTRQSGAVYTPYEHYHPDYRNGLDLTPGAHMPQQLERLLQVPMEIVGVIWKSTVVNAPSYAISYIGRLGWNLVSLPIGFILLAWMMLAVGILERRENYPAFRRKDLTCIAGIFLSIWVLIILSQYLTWEQVGAERVMLLQGRYYIPLFPLLWVMLSALPIRSFKIPQIGLIIWFLMCIGITLGTVMDWYYGG